MYMCIRIVVIIVAHHSSRSAQNTMGTRGTEVTPMTCGTGGERAQMILVWVQVPDIGNASHLWRLRVTRI